MKLTLPFPPSANRYWRHPVINGHPRTLLSREARAYREQCGWAARSQVKKMLSGPVSVRALFYFPNRRGDLDNRVKQLLDALNGIVFSDDSKVEHLECTRLIDKENPRVELEVSAIQPDKAA